ncbi:MAG: VWA domain-containing protein [Gammaproteobacteria bacterium]
MVENLIQNIHFLRPDWLWLLLPLAMLLMLLWHKQKPSRHWRDICDPHLIPHVVVRFGSGRRHLFLFSLAMTWLFAVTALAGPSWQLVFQSLYKTTSSRVLVLDLSAAMWAEDIVPNRLTRAKYKIRDLIEQSKEGQLGMIAFSGEAYVVSPLTEDAATIEAMLPELTPYIMPVGGSNIAAALNEAAQLLEQAEQTSGEILLITANAASASDLSVAQRLREQGLQISVLGVGTVDGAPIPNERGFSLGQEGEITLSRLDPQSLAELARQGGGQYTELTQDGRDITMLLSEQFSEDYQAGEQDQQTEIWQDQGRYFLWLLLPFILLIFRRGWLEAITQ